MREHGEALLHKIEANAGPGHKALHFGIATFLETRMRKRDVRQALGQFVDDLTGEELSNLIEHIRYMFRTPDPKAATTDQFLDEPEDLEKPTLARRSGLAPPKPIPAPRHERKPYSSIGEYGHKRAVLLSPRLRRFVF
jgi:hypothetical protein